jgi:hypothetical protein
MEELSCAELSVTDACLQTQHEGQACFDETVFPWNRIFICAFAHTKHHAVQTAGLWFLISVATLLFIWASVGVLAKVLSLLTINQKLHIIFFLDFDSCSMV